MISDLLLDLDQYLEDDPGLNFNTPTAILKLDYYSLIEQSPAILICNFYITSLGHLDIFTWLVDPCYLKKVTEMIPSFNSDSTLGHVLTLSLCVCD